jgi:hypothetical protein
MSPLLMIVVATAVLGLKRAFELVLEKEYPTWGPALARLFVRAAGLVYRPRRDQWEADLRYMQQVEGESGLLPAGWCLLTVPGLILRHAGLILRHVTRRSVHSVPLSAEKLLLFALPATISDLIIEDLTERFPYVQEFYGNRFARAWYWRHAVGAAIRFVGPRLAGATSPGAVLSAARRFLSRWRTPS